ncbi:hypothetical protein PM082_018444 [Marasmius tenuissimus]|nr:hypothetical protein PM082_018444 [Marasmius tenuissimus]
MTLRLDGLYFLFVQSDLQVLINNLLDIWAVIDPRRIMNKVKLHVLTRLPEDVRQLGLPITFATEAFECYNAVFRFCRILSNHLAPSRDIALNLADIKRFKHMVSGGFWWDAELKKYVQGEVKVRNFLRTNREMQRRLGWVDQTSPIEPGFVKRNPKGNPKKSPNPLPWQTMARQVGLPNPRATHETSMADMSPVYERCKCVISSAKDVCYEKSWDFFKPVGSESPEETAKAGRIIQILSPQEDKSTTWRAIVIIEEYLILAFRDRTYNMPILKLSDRKTVIPAKNVLFKFNAQHRCQSDIPDIPRCAIGESTTRRAEIQAKSKATREENKPAKEAAEASGAMLLGNSDVQDVTMEGTER